MKYKLYITLKDFYLGESGHVWWLHAEVRNVFSKIKATHGLMRLQKPTDTDYRFYAKKLCELLTSGRKATHSILDNGKVKINDDFQLIIDNTRVKNTEFDLSKFLECFEGDVVGIDSPAEEQSTKGKV